MSVQELTAKLTKFKPPMVVGTAGRIALSTTLGAVAVESDNNIKGLADASSARDCVEGSVLSIVSQSFRNVNDFVNQILT